MSRLTYDQQQEVRRLDATNRERAYLEARRNLPDLAAQVVAEMGKSWSVAPANPDDYDRDVSAPYSVHLDGPAGARLWLQVDFRRPERVNVRGVLEPGARYRIDQKIYDPARVEISVAVSRGARMVARDIARRLWPAYWAGLNADAAARAEEKAQADALSAAAADFAARFGMAMRTDTDNRRASGRWGDDTREATLMLRGDGGHGTVTVSADATILAAVLALVVSGAGS